MKRILIAISLVVMFSGGVLAVEPDQGEIPVYRAQLLGYLYQQACENVWGGDYVAGGPSSNFYQYWACEGGDICQARPDFFGCNKVNPL